MADYIGLSWTGCTVLVVVFLGDGGCNKVSTKINGAKDKMHDADQITYALVLFCTTTSERKAVYVFYKYLELMSKPVTVNSRLSLNKYERSEWILKAVYKYFALFFIYFLSMYKVNFGVYSERFFDRCNIFLRLASLVLAHESLAETFSQRPSKGYNKFQNLY